MTDNWYEMVEADAPLTQGDLIFGCPLLSWDVGKINPSAKTEEQRIAEASVGIYRDVVVLTQACDLENHKVDNVILCPHLGLSDYKNAWKDAMLNRKQNPSEKSWKRQCDDIRDGYVWNQTMLNNGNVDEHLIEHRIIDFHEVYTLPRAFLEPLLQQRGQRRFRLRSPYREHLSQSFARFFMRVGLPVAVSPVWVGLSDG
jgi:hypothetical protein